ncbi:MAG: LysR substrate-binding domain-containing protein [Pseudorhodoplanes sp.]
MTLDQLAAFVAVAERQHLTRAASALNLSSSAVSSAVKALETMHGVALFHRVGRGIELTSAGRRFLPEARDMLARARGIEHLLDELAGIERGVIELQASQTIANYWLPPRLVRFHAQYPGIEIKLQLGNTTTVTEAVISGAAELGFIEGTIREPALATRQVASDRLMIVVSAAQDHARASADDLLSLSWVMREPGSGTRSAFEAALRAHDIDPARLDVVMTLPSNEAVLSAVRTSSAATALSEAVVTPWLRNGDLRALPFTLDLRAFTLLRHKERPLSAVARAFETHCRSFPD